MILEFDVPVSLINDEKKPLIIKIKYFAQHISKLSEQMINVYNKHLEKIIQKYISEAGINANTFDLYDALHNEYVYFFTYRPKFIGKLAGNKILMQVIII